MASVYMIQLCNLQFEQGIEEGTEGGEAAAKNKNNDTKSKGWKSKYQEEG